MTDKFPSKTKLKNINRAVRQLERAFKILKDNKCSAFCSESGISIFPVPEIPRQADGCVDSEAEIEIVLPVCNYDAGAW